MDFSKFDDLLNKAIIQHDDDPSWDPYDVCGDMINHFISTHPRLKDGWRKMNTDEKWIFIEAIHYGIASGIRQKINK